MNAHRDDLTIDDVMADTLIGAVMKADGIDPRAFRDLLDRVAAARKRRDRCFTLSFTCARPRDARPWAAVKTLPATEYGAPRPW